MKVSVNLEERIQGCLIGAAIGAEFGFARHACPERFRVKKPEDIWDLELKPAGPVKQHPKRTNYWKSTPFIELGVRAYVNKSGRVTPEDFARELKNDRQIAKGVFDWDVVHTTQELLKEGCHPRLSGLGTAPVGLMAAAMPAVGIYHFCNPDYAYLDGVELASVSQPRLGADWAALSAAAIAAAFIPENGPEDIIKTVLQLAHENNKDLYYELRFAQDSSWRLGDFSKPDALERWRVFNGDSDTHRSPNWSPNNPLQYVLPLLKTQSDNAQKLMSLLLVPRNNCDVVNPVLAGALLGAMRGRQAFPKAWLAWAEPVAKPWFAITKVVESRKVKESEIIRKHEILIRKKVKGIRLLQDRIFGCLLASSIGNAMGSPVEGQLYTEIDGKHPRGISTILEPSRLESEDDNQMAMHLVETYLARQGRPVMARHFGSTWHEHLDRQHFFALCMGNTYDLIRQGWDPRITGHWNQVTGSTVMCMEPVGIYHIADPEFAVIDATAISYMYQRGLDVTAAAILVAAVTEALAPNATVDSVCRAALAAAPTERLRTFDRRPFNSCRDYLAVCLKIAGKYDDVLAARKELYQKCLFYHMIDPLEVIGLSLAMFKIAKGDVRQAAIGGTNIGRDSDTIAGRAAMLSGALRGSANVPVEWINMFGKAALDRIRMNAKRMSDLISKQKLAVYRKRQNVK